MTILRTAASASGAMSESLTVPTGDVYRLVSVTLGLNAAPTTSENYTITLDAVDGPNHDVLLYSLDIGAGGHEDVVWQPSQLLYLIGGDQVDVVWANTDNRTWGLLITVEKVA